MLQLSTQLFFIFKKVVSLMLKITKDESSIPSRESFNYLCDKWTYEKTYTKAKIKAHLNIIVFFL